MPRFSKTIVALFVVSILSLALSIYSATLAPAASSGRASSPSLAASRVFVLLPDGRVEITDALTRRMFRWDGKEWRELESTPSPRPAP